MANPWDSLPDAVTPPKGIVTSKPMAKQPWDDLPDATPITPALPVVPQVIQDGDKFGIEQPKQAMPTERPTSITDTAWRMAKDVSVPSMMGSEQVLANVGSQAEALGTAMQKRPTAKELLLMTQPLYAMTKAPYIPFAGKLIEKGGKKFKEHWMEESEQTRKQIMSPEAQESKNLAWEFYQSISQSTPQMLVDYLITKGVGGKKLKSDSARQLASSMMEGNSAGGQQKMQVENAIMQTPDEELAKLPDYEQTLLRNQGDVAKTKAEIAKTQGDIAYKRSFLTTSLTSLAFGGTIEKWLLDPKAGKASWRQIAKLGGIEMTEEGLQSAFDQINANRATGKPLEEGVAKATLMGAGAGLVMGAGLPTIHRLATPSPKTPTMPSGRAMPAEPQRDIPITVIEPPALSSQGIEASQTSKQTVAQPNMQEQGKMTAEQTTLADALVRGGVEPRDAVKMAMAQVQTEGTPLMPKQPEEGLKVQSEQQIREDEANKRLQTAINQQSEAQKSQEQPITEQDKAWLQEGTEQSISPKPYVAEQVIEQTQPKIEQTKPITPEHAKDIKTLVDAGLTPEQAVSAVRPKAEVRGVASQTAKNANKTQKEIIGEQAKTKETEKLGVVNSRTSIGQSRQYHTLQTPISSNEGNIKASISEDIGNIPESRVISSPSATPAIKQEAKAPSVAEPTKPVTETKEGATISQPRQAVTASMTQPKSAKKVKEPVTAGEGVKNKAWHKGYRKEKDPFQRNAILERVANSGRLAIDADLSEVLNLLEEDKVGSNAWNVAWAVSQNPNASQATKDKALSMREDWMRAGRFEEESQPTPKPRYSVAEQNVTQGGKDENVQGGKGNNRIEQQAEDAPVARNTVLGERGTQRNASRVQQQGRVDEGKQGKTAGAETGNKENARFSKRITLLDGTTISQNDKGETTLTFNDGKSVKLDPANPEDAEFINRIQANNKSETDKVEARLNELKGKVKGAKIVVVRTQNDLPEGLRGGANEKVEGVNHNGTSYLVAENIRPNHEARVLIHEAIVHGGLRGVFTEEELTKMLSNTYLNGKHEAEIQKKMKDRGITDRVEAIEEIIADIWSQKQVKPSLWQKFVASFRNMLRKFRDVEWSEADIDYLIYGINQKMDIGTPLQGEIRYSQTSDSGDVQEFMDKKRQELDGKTVEQRDITPSNPIGISNAKMKEQLLSVGKDDVPPAQRKADETVVDQAMNVVRANPSAPDNLVADLEREARVIEDWEHALLDYASVEVMGKYKRATQAYESETDSQARRELEQDMTRLQDDLYRIADAAKKAGSATARSLRFRQRLFNEDFTLVALDIKRRTANSGKPLTKEQQEQNKKFADKDASLTDEIKAIETERQKDVVSEQEKKVAGIIDKFFKSVKISDSVESKRAIKSKADEARARLASRGVIKPKVALPVRKSAVGGGLSNADIADLAVIGADYMANGARDKSAWEMKFHQDFGTQFDSRIDDIYTQAFESYMADRQEAAGKSKAKTDGKDKAKTKKAPTNLQEAMEAKLDDQIEELEKSLAVLDEGISLPTKAKAPKSPEYLRAMENLKAKINALNKLKAQVKMGKRVAKDIETNTPDFNDLDIQARRHILQKKHKDRLDEQISRLKKQLADEEQGISKQPKPITGKTPVTREIQDKIDKLDALRKQIALSQKITIEIAEHTPELNDLRIQAQRFLLEKRKRVADDMKNYALEQEIKDWKQKIADIRAGNYPEATIKVPKQVNMKLKAKVDERNRLRDEYRQILKREKVNGQDWINTIKDYAKERGIKIPASAMAEIEAELRHNATISDDMKRDMAMAKTLEKVASHLPLKLGDWFDAYIYTNMLSSPISHARNIFGNMTNQAFLKPLILALSEGKGSAGIYLKHSWKMLFDGTAIRAAKNAFVYGEEGKMMEGIRNLDESANSSNRLMNQIEQIRRKLGPTNKIGRGVWKSLTFVGRAMNAADVLFGTMIEEGEYQRLKAQGESEERSREIAHQSANKWLYRDALKAKPDAFLDPASKGLEYIGYGLDSLRNKPYLGRAVKMAIPFLKTPVKLAQLSAEFSAISAIGASKNNMAQKKYGETYDEMTAKLEKEQGKAKPDMEEISRLEQQINATEHAQKERMAKAMIGLMAFIIGSILASMGRTTWSAPKDERARNMFYDAGYKPYSIKIGNSWVPMIYFGPLALAFMVPAGIRDTWFDNPDMVPQGAEVKMLRTSVLPVLGLLDQLPLQGLSSMYNAFKDNAGYTFQKTIGRTVSQLMPLSGMAGWVNNIVDGTLRKPRTIGEEVKAGYPMFSKDVKPRLNSVTGEEIKSTTLDNILPYRIGKEDADNAETYKTYMASLMEQAMGRAEAKRAEIEEEK